MKTRLENTRYRYASTSRTKFILLAVARRMALRKDTALALTRGSASSQTLSQRLNECIPSL